MDNIKKEIENTIKPKILSGILITLVCIGPFGNLVFSIAMKNYNRLMIEAIFTLPTLILLGAYWCWHVIKKVNLKHDVDEILDLLIDNDNNYL